MNFRHLKVAQFCVAARSGDCPAREFTVGPPPAAFFAPRAGRPE
ncbi:hypothetical protein BN134_2506 [Cronobacter dublinensis 1210]|uniref:Uncharacterized protein n=1 Tax=Cronobacter dublinensis 1210 TaxID=1208656 RepID=A0ABP1W883_9ENTR|nr:hypothetical protein BN134_2506 [Cronobacter dublinensis 1210]